MPRKKVMTFSSEPISKKRDFLYLSPKYLKGHKIFSTHSINLKFSHWLDIVKGKVPCELFDHPRIWRRFLASIHVLDFNGNLVKKR